MQVAINKDNNNTNNKRPRRFRKRENNQVRKNRRVNRINVQKNKYIVNLSSRTLSDTEISLLSKGLAFIPTPNKKTADYTDPVNQLARTLRLRYFFRNNNNTTRINTPFRKKSTWMPPAADKEIEEYIKNIPTKLAKVKSNNIRPNTTKQEWTALKALAVDDTIIIRTADKGSCVVVENRAEYIENGEQHLANRDIYCPIDNDPTLELCKSTNNYITGIYNKGYLSEHMKNYLSHPEPSKVRTQQLYFMKKLHKTPHDIRPIVSGSSGPTENLSSFMDFYLCPLVKNTASYIRDSKSIIALMETLTFPDNCILCTIDVKSLYLNIPQEEGIQAALDHLYIRNPEADLLPFPRSVAKEILQIVLQHNYFEFNSCMHKQVRGTAMGTKMAPAFANLFMDTLETDFLSKEIIKPLLWQRYIDDIICIWPGEREELTRMLDRLNLHHNTIKFTFDISDSTAVFLDLELYKGPRFNSSSKFDIRPHFKNTNSFQYLQYTSSHPKSTYKGIIKGELIRILRASTDEQTFVSTSNKLMIHFRDRGYPTHIIRDIKNQVKFEDRPNHLKDKSTDNTDNLVNFCIQYDQHTDQRELRNCLKPPSNYIPTPQISYKKNKSISNYIVRARIKNTKEPTSTTSSIRIGHRPSFRKFSAPCGKTLCGCCHHMSKKERVHTRTGLSYPTAINTDCNTKNAVYLLECKKCNKKYVGQTSRPLRNRFSGHRAAFYLKTKNMPLYNHFRTQGHEFKELSITILEITSHTLLLQRELYWISKLDTIIPSGLNSKFS